MANLDVQRLRPAQMPSSLYARWQACADRYPLKTAFIQPDFVRWCAEFNSNIEVLCASQDSLHAFLPVIVENRCGGDYLPGLTDYTGLLLEEGFQLDARKLLKQAGLKSLYLNSSIEELDDALCRAHYVSPYIEMGPEQDYWLQQLKQRKSSRLATSLRNARKATREFGELRLDLYNEDDQAFKKLRQWKSAQRQQTGTHDIFQIDWAADMLRALPAYRGPNVCGALSCLYAGDELLAVHLGMHSKHTLHWWLTTYNPELRKYSPGANLLIELARSAQLNGLSRIDLGYGEEGYKNSFKNGSVDTYSLVLDASPVRASIRRLAEQSKAVIKNSPIEQQARKAYQLVFGH